MTANDTATRRVTTGIVLAVGLFAGSDSYSHIYTLARDHGQAIVSAALLPLAGDGLIAAASSAMLVASRQGRDVPVLARVMLLAGSAPPSPRTSATGSTRALPGRCCRCGQWPPMSAAWSCSRGCGATPGCTRRYGLHLRMWQQMQPMSWPAAAIPEGGLLEAAGRAFPAAGAGNVPSLREIQRALRVGQGKAQQVQAHLAGRSADPV